MAMQSVLSSMCETKMFPSRAEEMTFYSRKKKTVRTEMGLDHQVLIVQGAESLGSWEPPPPLVHSGNLPLRVDMG